MLPVKLQGDALQRVAMEGLNGREIEVDLPRQVILSADGKELCQFDIPEFKKDRLINCLDDISLTMELEAKICDFEGRRRKQTPWLDGVKGIQQQGKIKLQPISNAGFGSEKLRMESLQW
jgi:3-isopropylmalate dehydratase